MFLCHKGRSWCNRSSTVSMSLDLLVFLVIILAVQDKGFMTKPEVIQLIRETAFRFSFPNTWCFPSSHMKLVCVENTQLLEVFSFSNKSFTDSLLMSSLNCFISPSLLCSYFLLVVSLPDMLFSFQCLLNKNDGRFISQWKLHIFWTLANVPNP